MTGWRRSYYGAGRGDQWQEWYPEEAYFTADYEADEYAEESWHADELYAWYTDDAQGPWVTTGNILMKTGRNGQHGMVMQLPGTKEAHQPGRRW